MRSNCLIWAVSLWLRRSRKGAEGYLMWRRSRLGTVCGHVLYGEMRRGRLRIVNFVPTNGKPKNLPPPLFPGRSKWGDL